MHGISAALRREAHELRRDLLSTPHAREFGQSTTICVAIPKRWFNPGGLLPRTAHFARAGDLTSDQGLSVKRGMFIAFVCMVGFASGARPSEPLDEVPRGRAQIAVHEAEAAVKAAAEQGALWTTARDALRDAWSALENGDFEAAEAWARFAVEHAQLGIQQLDYPHFSLQKDGT